MSDGKPINVLIIDSEGIGALDTETNHDSRIFSLALLLCWFVLFSCELCVGHIFMVLSTSLREPVNKYPSHPPPFPSGTSP